MTAINCSVPDLSACEKRRNVRKQHFIMLADYIVDMQLRVMLEQLLRLTLSNTVSPLVWFPASALLTTSPTPSHPHLRPFRVKPRTIIEG